MQIEPSSITIAVDFDGTCVEADYPYVGKDLPHAVQVLKRLQAENCKIILWTMRDGFELLEAVHWFEKNGITLFGIQRNPEQKDWTENYGSPKCCATYYIDDRAIGVPLVLTRDRTKPPAVNWVLVEELLEQKGVLSPFFFS